MITYLIGSEPKWMMIDGGNLLSCDIDVDDYYDLDITFRDSASPL